MRITLLVVAVLALAGAAQAQGKAAWLADPKTGCKIFDNDPEPGETITWSGKCVNGVAEGRGHLENYVKGKLESQYDGDMKAGKVSGQGTLRFPDGSRYVGGVLDGKRHGHGVETWPGGARFEGEYVNDVRNGHGIETMEDGGHFEGEFHNDRPNGQGTFVHKGHAFSGNWVEGCFRQGGWQASVDTTDEACGFGK